MGNSQSILLVKAKGETGYKPLYESWWGAICPIVKAEGLCDILGYGQVLLYWLVFVCISVSLGR